MSAVVLGPGYFKRFLFSDQTAIRSWKDQVLMPSEMLSFSEGIRFAHSFWWSLILSLADDKMQLISFAFINVNSVKFAYSARIEDQIYICFGGDTFMWPNVNESILTHQIAIRSVKTH